MMLKTLGSVRVRLDEGLLRPPRFRRSLRMRPYYRHLQAFALMRFTADASAIFSPSRPHLKGASSVSFLPQRR
jgi:hypothetical protein